MDSISDEIADIKARIASYRKQKEDEIVGSGAGTRQRGGSGNHDYNAESPSTMPSSSISKDALVTMNTPFRKFAAKEDMNRFLDVDCILSPCAPLAGGEWPASLISSYIERCADVGSMDSHGSLWKLLRKDIGVQGTHVMLQSAEIGEKSLYLTPSLVLTPDVNAAAVWTLKTQRDVDNAHAQSTSTGKLLKPTLAFAILVQFVLVGRKLDGSIDASCFDNEQTNKHRNLVAAKASSGSGEKGVAALTQAERALSNDTFHWAITWQITREDNAIDGFAFLDSVSLDYAV